MTEAPAAKGALCKLVPSETGVLAGKADVTETKETLGVDMAAFGVSVSCGVSNANAKKY